MPTLAEIRQQYPQYRDMPDAALADALHRKFYSDVPREEFDKRIGYQRGPGTLSTAQGASADAPKQFGLEDTWPAKLAKSVVSAVTLPGDVYAGRARLPSSGAVPGSVPFGDPDSAGERVADLAMMASPVNPMVRAGDKAIPGVARNLVPSEHIPVPTAQQLKDAADAGYKSASALGVDYDALAVKARADQLRAGLEQDGIFAELAPKTFSIIARLQQPPEGAVASLGNLSAARKALGHAAGDVTNKTEQLAATRAIDELDQFIAQSTAPDVVAGPAAEAARILEDARGNYAAAMRSNKLTGELSPHYSGAIERAELNADVAHSGQNIDNNIRQRLRDILVKPKEARGYSEEELTRMREVARGSVPTNIARGVGNMLGGGGGLGAIVSSAVGGGMGGAAAGPYGSILGAAAPVAGYASKQIANALTRRAVGKLDETVRQRSPLFRDTARDVPTVPLNPTQRMMLLRAIMESVSADR